MTYERIMYSFNIAVVEDINKKREPLATMEAVYLITPSEESVRSLMRDFENPNRPLYKGAHVFFTEGIFPPLNMSSFLISFLFEFLFSFNLLSILMTAIPNKILELLKNSKVVKFMKTCKEINIAFIPYEQQVNFLIYFFFV